MNATFNEIAIDAVGKVSWNGQPVTDAQLEALLKRARQLPVEPELRLTPQVTAPYEVMHRVMSIAQHAGTTKIGFVGNEAYTPGAEPK